MDRDWVDYIVAAVQVLSLIALIIYVIKTWEMASATRDAAQISAKVLEHNRTVQDQEVAPYMVVYLDIPYGDPWIYLVVKNVGKTIAENVRITFDPPITRKQHPPLAKLPLEDEQMGSFPPGYEARTFFDSTIEYFAQENVPASFKVTTTYTGGLNKTERSTTQVIDLAMYKGTSYLHEPSLKDVVKAITDLSKHSKKQAELISKLVSNVSRGIWIQGAGITSVEQPLDEATWKASVAAQLRETRTLWGEVYSNIGEEVYGAQIDNLRGRTAIIRSQLVAAIANPPSDVEAATLASLLQVTAKLFTLDAPRVLMELISGHPGIDRFCAELMPLVREAITLLSSYTSVSSSNKSYIGVKRRSKGPSYDAGNPTEKQSPTEIGSN